MHVLLRFCSCSLLDVKNTRTAPITRRRASFTHDHNSSISRPRFLAINFIMISKIRSAQLFCRKNPDFESCPKVKVAQSNLQTLVDLPLARISNANKKTHKSIAAYFADFAYECAYWDSIDTDQHSTSGETLPL